MAAYQLGQINLPRSFFAILELQDGGMLAGEVIKRGRRCKPFTDPCKSVIGYLKTARRAIDFIFCLRACQCDNLTEPIGYVIVIPKIESAKNRNP